MNTHTYIWYGRFQYFTSPKVMHNHDFFWVNIFFQVHAYIAQLKLILKGDIVSARRMSDNVTGTDVVIDPNDEYNDEDEDANYNQVNFEQHTWTSAQHREARSILIKFKAERIKKCQNCLRDNPKISSPELGTINIVMNQTFLPFHLHKSDYLNDVFLSHNDSHIFIILLIYHFIEFIFFIDSHASLIFIVI